MNQRIFLVEDDSDIARLVCHHLETAGYVVRAFPAIAGVLGEAVKSRPALFLLDIMLHGGSGLALCEEIRQCETLAATPVIFLTAKSSESDRVLGFELGADDYITKPFSPRELVARVRAVLRRFELLSPTGIREFGDFRIDSDAMTVTFAAKASPPPQPSFASLIISSVVSAAFSRVTNFSALSGATPPSSSNVRSTSTSGAYA